MNEIYLKDIWLIHEAPQKEYKISFHTHGPHSQPLDIFAREPKELRKWNAYSGKRRDFNRLYALSLVQFYPEGNDIWLFTGIYEYDKKPRRNEKKEIHKTKLRRAL